METMPPSLADHVTLHPIGNGLNEARKMFHIQCLNARLPVKAESVDQLKNKALHALGLAILKDLHKNPVAQLLHNPFADRDEPDHLTLQFGKLIESAEHDLFFDLDRTIQIIKAVLDEYPLDVLIWGETRKVLLMHVLPPPVVNSAEQEAAIKYRSMDRFETYADYRRYVDKTLKSKVGPYHVGLGSFHDTFFAGIPGVEEASENLLRLQCMGLQTRFENGWQGWPRDMNNGKQVLILRWLRLFSEKLEQFCVAFRNKSPSSRRTFRTPTLAKGPGNLPIRCGFTDGDPINLEDHGVPSAFEVRTYKTKQVVIVGEVSSEIAEDAPLRSWLRIGKYAAEMLATLPGRRFIHGFTLCGPVMRTWLFDRAGVLGSDAFNINKDALRFIQTMYAYLWMDSEQLGFDPTMKEDADGSYYFDLHHGRSRPERIIVTEVISQRSHMTGRGTTCYKAYLKRCPECTLVIKDSWQPPRRSEEGKFLQNLTRSGARGVVRHYHHETIRSSDGAVVDIHDTVRKGINPAQATEFRAGFPIPHRALLRLPEGISDPSLPPSIQREALQWQEQLQRKREERGQQEQQQPLPPDTDENATTEDLPRDKKRPASDVGSASERPSKKARTGEHNSRAHHQDRHKRTNFQNRVLRRLILLDCGKPIDTASTPQALCAALEGCIKGYEAILGSGVVHRDIAVKNMVINEDGGRGYSPMFSFLIDLDFACGPGDLASKECVGTRVFMAIRLHEGEENSFMHDLESFFWVLLWVCVSQTGPGMKVNDNRLARWHSFSHHTLAELKRGIVEGAAFRQFGRENVQNFYKPLIPCLEELRRILFPHGHVRTRPNQELSSKMRTILRKYSGGLESRA